MSKRTYKDIPLCYSVCIHSDCPRAATCLHTMAYDVIAVHQIFLTVVNPKLCNTSGTVEDKDVCKFYRNSAPVRYTIGFTNFQTKMFPQQYQTFMSICIKHWSRNPYFERKRGERPIPPKEQEFILNALKEAGVTETMEFDKYEEMINWFDYPSNLYQVP